MCACSKMAPSSRERNVNIVFLVDFFQGTSIVCLQINRIYTVKYFKIIKLKLCFTQQFYHRYQILDIRSDTGRYKSFEKQLYYDKVDKLLHHRY